MLKEYTATNRKSGEVQTFKFDTEIEKFELPSGSQARQGGDRLSSTRAVVQAEALSCGLTPVGHAF